MVAELILISALAINDLTFSIFTSLISLTNPLSKQVVTAIRTVVGPGPVALHEPSFTGNEWLYLKECLDSTFVSSVGKFVDRFESDLASFTGAKHAVAVVNGTAALWGPG